MVLSNDALLGPRRMECCVSAGDPHMAAVGGGMGTPNPFCVSIFPPAWRKRILISKVGIYTWLLALSIYAYAFSFESLLKFYIAKGAELNNPMDPSSGETGNVLYVMGETYAAPGGIASHMAKGGADWSGMADLGPKHEKYGVFMEAGSCTTFTLLSDDVKCDVTAVGQPSVHIVWRVPEADEAEIDAYWKGHETWMRGSHVMSLEGDDADKPRLTSFSINKGKELNNPMDPSSGFTGNLMYIMSETYVAPEGVASHMAKAGAEWAGMPDLPVKHEKYGVFMEAGSCSVFTNLGDKMK